MEPKWWFICSFVSLLFVRNLMQLVLFHLICLFRTVLLLIYLYLFDLVEILIFDVKQLNFSTVRKWSSRVYSHLRIITSHIKNVNLAVVFGM